MNDVNCKDSPLSKDWKMIITYGNPRTVHARGCNYIKDWSIYGSEELTKLKPDKHYICPLCAGLCYATLGARDFNDNINKYKKLFIDGEFGPVSSDLLKDLYFTNRAKTSICGSKIYIHSKQDDWYIDTDLGYIKLFHNNYKVRERERGKEDYKDIGYHEHKLVKDKKQPLANAIKSIISYNYEEATKSHQKNRKKKAVITFSEYDPESWGFTD